MARDWETTFSRWKEPPGVTEQAKIDNALNMIRSAISNSSKLNSRNIKVFVQGSYHNRVNVKNDSDVDVGIVCYDVMFTDFIDDNIKQRLNFSDAEYTYQVFKNEIEEALVDKFGRLSVRRGSKAFDIHENTYHVEADVAAFFEHRRYTSVTHYLSGVELRPDNFSNKSVINWPEQHYKNGVSKNTNTNKRYKMMVRIIKSLTNEMADNNIISATKIPGFLNECLVWNVPNTEFSSYGYTQMVRSVLAWLFNNTMFDNQCDEWGEVSDLKYLFNYSQSWSRSEVHTFLNDAWNYIGFE